MWEIKGLANEEKMKFPFFTQKTTEGRPSNLEAFTYKVWRLVKVKG